MMKKHRRFAPLVIASTIVARLVIAQPAGKNADLSSFSWGLHFLPYALETGESESSPPPFLSPDGFEVRLTPLPGQDDEIGYPCGIFFRPAPGRYKYWLEGESLVSPTQSVLTFSGIPPDGESRIHRFPVGPAGRIAFEPSPGSCTDCTLRVVHVDSHRFSSVPQNEFTRRVPPELARTGVQVPKGTIIAGMYDDESGAFHALSRPIVVSAGKTTIVSPLPPESGADIVVVLDRPELLESWDREGVQLTLRPESGPAREPDVTISSVGRVIGFWYAVESRYATLTATSSEVMLHPVELSLRNGKVVEHRGSLDLLPSVDVDLALPDGLHGLPIEVSVTRLVDSTLERTVEIGGDASSCRLSRLPAEPLEIGLSIGPWRFEEKVDLSSGQDRAVYFEPAAMRVEGTVYEGDEPHAGDISFWTGNDAEDRLWVQTDEAGRYQATLFRPGLYVIEVLLAGRENAPILNHERVTGGMELDFFVPKNDFTVKVVDSESGDGLPGSTVSVTTTWGSGGSATTQTMTANEEGVVRLPPVRPGTLQVRARADGYLRGKLQERQVSDEEATVTMVVPLTRESESTTIDVRLPDGRPAAGAEALVLLDLTRFAPVWEGVVDSAGELSVPVSDLYGWLLLRHPETGFLVSRLSAWVMPEDLTLPSAGPPLTVRAVWENGEPVQNAFPAVWTPNAGWMLDATIRWLTWRASAATTSEGVWRVTGMPAQQLRIAMWKRAAPPDLGLLESGGIPISNPWPGLVEVEVID